MVSVEPPLPVVTGLPKLSSTVNTGWVEKRRARGAVPRLDGEGQLVGRTGRNRKGVRGRTGDGPVGGVRRRQRVGAAGRRVDPETTEGGHATDRGDRSGGRTTREGLRGQRHLDGVGRATARGDRVAEAVFNRHLGLGAERRARGAVPRLDGEGQLVGRTGRNRKGVRGRTGRWPRWWCPTPPACRGCRPSC